MTSGKSFITVFTLSLPRQPMDPVGQASIARTACRRSVLEPGWALTKDVAAASPNTAGAICRQASQSIQVESTKKSPATFTDTRFLGLAMTEPPSAGFPLLLFYAFTVATPRRRAINRGVAVRSPEIRVPLSPAGPVPVGHRRFRVACRKRDKRQ